MPSWYAINPHIPKHVETNPPNVFTMTRLAYAYTHKTVSLTTKKNNNHRCLFLERIYRANLGRRESFTFFINNVATTG
jgi:hypothetical protein